ncbi:MAG: AAA family ATPase, partial [Planctomycetota bacterium]|nr:AAA family ATPase [Planctomycetota bacterium]
MSRVDTAPAPFNSPPMAARITLVGMRGCGKSSVGRALAERLGWPFVDADREFELREQQSIAAWFAQRGEAAFRAAEAELLAELLQRPAPWVLATGGGVVLLPGNRQRLRAAGGLVVYLEAPQAVLEERLARDPGRRPSLTGRPLAEEVESVLAQRAPLYREVADLSVASDRPLADIVA